MFSTNDTIVAIATPAGRGAIGVVRLSGPSSSEIGSRLLQPKQPLEPRVATLARLETEGVKDDVLATFFRGPHSYTGDDVLELSAHGSDAVLQGIVQGAIRAGARLAAPGEFTLRAYLNGKFDLIQAEAVADLIEATTPVQARAAFEQLDGTLTHALTSCEQRLFELEAEVEASIDFPDEGYHFIDPSTLAARVEGVVEDIDSLLSSANRGRLIREGLRVVIAGPPNAGKSRLFNALVGANRSIVSEVAGTTRDMVSEVVDFDGLRVTLVDTAGLTESTDPIEREGVARALDAVGGATVAVVVVDGSSARVDVNLDTPASRCVFVASKADLPSRWSDAGCLPVSAITGVGLDRLVARISEVASGDEGLKDSPRISNVRHITALERTRDLLGRLVRDLLSERVPSEECALIDLRGARQQLEEIVGRRGSEDVLAHIFARFCIGK
ncbi:MAG: tRNA uridine-5-carboxymethylaminomethyl(34) synthesis GTPase MnmE [Vicinamibacterales bacterium]